MKKWDDLVQRAIEVMLPIYNMGWSQHLQLKSYNVTTESALCEVYETACYCWEIPHEHKASKKSKFDSMLRVHGFTKSERKKLKEFFKSIRN